MNQYSPFDVNVAGADLGPPCCFEGGPDWFASDFRFVAPVVGPFDKELFVDSLKSFDLKTAFPNLSSNSLCGIFSGTGGCKSLTPPAVIPAVRSIEHRVGGGLILNNRPRRKVRGSLRFHSQVSWYR